MFPVACNFCLSFKPLEEFRLEKKNKSGHTQPCKACCALKIAIRRAMAHIPKIVTLSLPKKRRDVMFAYVDGSLMWRCKECLQCKSLDKFPKKAKARHGHSQPCKVCATEQQKARVAREKLKNPEAYAAKQRKVSVTWVRLNPAKRSAISARYARNHPAQVAANMARRRARVAQALIIEEVDRQVVYARDHWICQICHKRVPKTRKFPHPLSASIDHIIPLSEGGEESYRNCVLAHFGCNARKQARTVAQQMRLLS